MGNIELVKLAGTFRVAEREQCTTTNFMSWERLDREVLKGLYPSEYVTGLTISERGLEIHLERIPEATE